METREVIAEQWLGRVLRTYPSQTAAFLAGEKDSFRNPVGHTLREGLGILVEELLCGMNQGRLHAALDSIVQIRAVQSFTPRQALEFLFQVKPLLEKYAGGPGVELLDSRVDEMMLTAIELYVQYRERTFECRANEAKRRVHILERRLTCETQ